MLPLNTSGRTKTQIVEEAEQGWLRPMLVSPEDHTDVCRCMGCFNRKLDTLIASQEAEITPAISVTTSLIVERF
jgi:hypothetical protein